MKKLQRAAELIALIRRLGHDSALVGGLAVSARARERFTRDVDFAVAVSTDEEAEKLALSMQREGFRLTTVIEQEAHGIIGTLRFRDPRERSEEPSLDLLCGSCGIEREVVRDATSVMVVPDVEIPVARLPHLLAMKVLAENEVRVHDQADIQALLRAATIEELHETRHLLQLIAKRGFHRDKELEPRLSALIERFGGPDETGTLRRRKPDDS